jgi:molybdate transport system substrate-binding protein
VMLGSVDAGLVYASDTVAAGDRVEAVPLARSVGTEYPVAVVEGTDEPGLAREFVDLVRSAAGAQVLGRAGLRPAGAR